MLDAAKEILSGCPLPAEAIAVDADCDPDQLLETAGKFCDALDDGTGVLVLTDLYGSTPSNIANRLIETHNASVISGANLPMLLRILNYPDMSLEALCDKAATVPATVSSSPPENRRPDMQQRPVTIINKLGLHARAAARFVTTASSFSSQRRCGKKWTACQWQKHHGRHDAGGITWHGTGHHDAGC